MTISLSSPQLTLYATVCAYLVLMLGIGLWANGANKRHAQHHSGFIEEYFLAGRKLGGFTLAMSIITTYTSASSFIGGPGMAYTLGLGWVLLAMIQVPTTFLTLGIMGKRLSRFSKATGSVTISDFLRHRYKSPLLAVLTSVFMLVFFIAIMLAQFIGGARVLEATTGAPYQLGLIFFAVTVIIYTTLGGFRAVVLTDLVQGFVMLFAAMAVLWGVINAGGGLSTIMDTLSALDQGLVAPTGPNNAIPVPFMLSFWVLVGLGVLGLPQTAQKCMAFSDEKSLRQAMIVGTITIGFILLCTHLTGALGRAVVPDLEAGDLIMPTLIVTLMPPFFAGLFIAGVLAAIMSTISSMLIMSSATLICDIYIEWKLKGQKMQASQTFIRRISFGITALLGVIVFFMALSPPDLLVWINLFAFGGLEAVFLWPVVLGLYWNKANASGALSSILVGVFVFLGLSICKPPMGGVHPIVPSLALGGAAFAIVTALTTKKCHKGKQGSAPLRE